MASREALTILSVTPRDVRFPTSRYADGSDAMHVDPDYSCVYVVIETDTHTAYGMTFTLGRGNEIVKLAVNSLKYLVEGRSAHSIFNNFAAFWRELTSDSQMIWLGPEKGVAHLAAAAIINGLWDLWARVERKPVWRLLADLEPEQLVSCIDFRYIDDVVTPAEAIEMLRAGRNGREQRIADLQKNGYPCYTTQVGWLGYTDEKIRRLCKEYLANGFTAFKLKVGQDINGDIKRCRLVREEIGWKNRLMVDANQVWGVNESIEWMEKLVEFKPYWIEEPTSPDDVLGHAKISKALNKHGILVASGENCCNRVMFKQFLQANAIQICQIDSCRIGGINEILSVYLMAKKLGVRCWPHAGGVGLCEMVQHLQMWDYVSLSCTKEDRMVEWVDQQHDQFIHPATVKNACYVAPTAPGYNTELKKGVLEQYEFPNGTEWRK